jgi:glycosyltransferase involved in cell wall biosynthesis
MNLSIIIPCYNSGAYLPDALQSIKQAVVADGFEYEVIIVDDGSTDAATLTLLAQLRETGYQVITQPNAGPAAARNTGVSNSTGSFLLFLDSDNKIKPHFIPKSMAAHETYQADIVHGQPDFFGDSTMPRFKTGKFDIHRVLEKNYIDMCSMVTRALFEQVGGFDENRLLIGFEDWDFFIRAYAAGARFQFVDEPLYDYRVVAGSLSQKHTYEHIQQVKQFVYSKNVALLISSFEWYCQQNEIAAADRRRPFRSLLKFLYLKYLVPRK